MILKSIMLDFCSSTYLAFTDIWIQVLKLMLSDNDYFVMHSVPVVVRTCLPSVYTEYTVNDIHNS